MPFFISADAGRVGVLGTHRETAREAWEVAERFRARQLQHVVVKDADGHELPQAELAALVAAETGKTASN